MSTAEVDEVEAVINHWAQAYRSRDIDGLLSTAIGDEVQLVGTGADEIRFGLDEYRAQVVRDYSQSDDVAFQLSNMHVTTVGDAAFAYCDVAVSGSAGGQHFEMSGLRMTAGLVHTDEGWRFVQSHLSAPDGAQAEGQSFEA